MEQEKTLIKGGSFLIEDADLSRVFTPEDFTEEHKMIAKTTEDYVNTEVMPLVEKLENHEFEHSVKLLKKAGELGLLGADVPEQYDGLGLDKIASALIAEKMSKAGGFSITHGAHVGIGSLPIVLFGNEEQKKKYLPVLATGEKIAAYALTEPSSGSDALGAKTVAKLNEAGTHYVLNGEKQWITNAGFADVFVVYAKIDGEQFSAFIVERDFGGVSVGPEEKKMGIKSSSTRTLILEDAEVPVENLLGEAGRGHIIAFNILNIGRYKLGVGTIGASKRAMELTIPYTNQRQQFKTPISSFNLTKEKLATMASKLYAVESSVYRTVGLFEDRMSGFTDEQQADGKLVADSIAEFAIECSLNKFFGTETLDYIVDEGVQLHGGYGFMQEYEIERIYRDSRINRIFEGTNEINRLLVPGTLLRKAMKGELPLLEHAQALQEELLMMMPEEVGTEALAQEKALVKNAKKIAILAAGLAAQTYGKKLEAEQEVLVNIADIVSNVFAMESVVLRTEKAIAASGEEKAKQKLLYTQIFCQEALEEIEKDAKETLIAAIDGDNQRMMLSALRKLTRSTPYNLIAKKREASEKLINTEKYVV
ncbi:MULTISPECIES: acyl-CoA dehydrogenase family protein [unclassified Planococcus (in: firmicutes)]|uniref:acyl-CoA dehydrogenase family protein n=1 Tax=unclassified Planococcus (in: firmicutes) TaxID=2662419 RepID=UPI000C324D62|nr:MULTISPECIES: acyl-CoA dehydrogenase family protein [unclassified Planococcus (in: firmicutes)]AUD13487.1 acyl-CoA dehydrogenase [Planococcus sp. MB-3u-03]PKG46088.1 acyl-CoA dehydrogenase [Planococcus sp. Urea-trap-24]PKG89923.1 acyl-CoA dehydrogenase [Planococcus sp. Urea-3u-39]PKH40544.1 acyl-CoA dehydrogenase [Planococcus sp. MB-3u-09]